MMGGVNPGGSKPYRDRLREDLVKAGITGLCLTEQVAADLARQGMRPRRAWRYAGELSQRVAAMRFNEVTGDPRATMTTNRIWDFERWPSGGVRPTVRTLTILARIYGTTWDLLVDAADLAHMPDADREAYAEAASSRARAIGADPPRPAEEIHIRMATADRITTHVTIPGRKRAYRCSCPSFTGWPGNRNKNSGPQCSPSPRTHARGQPVDSRNGQTQPTSADADHPLRRVRRRRGLTQVELAGLAGLSFSYISMIECGRRRLTRRDHVTALAAALRVPPAEIAPSMSPGPGEWAPAPSAPVSAFPPVTDDIAAARHRELAGQLIGYVSRGDTYAAGAWLRRMARDPSVNPWLLLDQLTAPDLGLSGPRSRPLGGSGARLVSAGSSGRGRAG